MTEAKTTGTRIKNVSKNAIVSFTTHFAQIFLGFIIRKLFITYLGVTYLGYNSVFSNILQMLNLADLGIGIAITSYLYKPLADRDFKRISSLMYIYKKMYSIMGCVVICIGLIVSFFLGQLIPDADCSLSFLRILFYINLAGTVSTYFVAYKRTLIIADQKSYITNIYDTVMYFIVSILQVLVLILYPNYIIYLALNILKNIISNIILSVKANKMYGFLNQNVDKKRVEEYRPQIYQYIKDVFVSRIGAVIYYSTDNVILSVIKGSLLTGYLSNYTLITTQLNTVVVQVLNSLQATFGNYISMTPDLTKQRKMTDNYFCVNFCIGNFCMICFSLLAQPFIKLFLGENMLLSFSTAVWLGVNLMLTFLIQLPSQVFVIYRLYRYDRLIIIVSAVLNILISVLLTNYIGINGVLIGTFATSLIYLFFRFYVISKYVYKVNFVYYITKLLRYGLISVVSFVVTLYATNSINGNKIVGLGIKCIFVVVLSVLTTAFLLSFTEEFSFLINKLIPSKFRKYINKVFIGGLAIIFVNFALLTGQLYGNQSSFKETGNKSYIRKDSYVSENQVDSNIFHLSFDDTITIFEDITENEYYSIFDNSTLNWFKQLHDEYGVVMSCYVYYEDGDFNLTQVQDKYKKEFIDNADWLRFGFHSRNANTDYKNGKIKSDYTFTITELERIVGCEAIDNFIRLSMFKGSYEGIKELTLLSDEPVVGLLTADDCRNSYYLNKEDNAYIYVHDKLYDDDLGIWLVSTDFRTEYVDSVDYKIKELKTNSWNNQTGDLVVFTHEWVLSVENKEKVEKICKYAMENGYKFNFFEDVLTSSSMK